MTKGNIILIHSRFDPIGALIQLFTRSYWHHVGIFIDNERILEVKGKSIVITHSRKYIYNKLYECKIVLAKNLKPTQIKKAIAYMLTIAETGYFKWVRACIMAAFDSKKELPRRTCSGLIAEGFAEIGFYFRKDKQPCCITPADISESNKVKNITGKSLFKRII